jgi:hypothetical protein
MHRKLLSLETLNRITIEAGRGDYITLESNKQT